MHKHFTTFYYRLFHLRIILNSIASLCICNLIDKNEVVFYLYTEILQKNNITLKSALIHTVQCLYSHFNKSFDDKVDFIYKRLISRSLAIFKFLNLQVIIFNYWLYHSFNLECYLISTLTFPFQKHSIQFFKSLRHSTVWVQWDFFSWIL